MMSKTPKTIHVNYTKVYLDVLQYEEVLDIDINRIYQAFLKVLSEERRYRDLNAPPKARTIRRLVELTLRKLEV